MTTRFLKISRQSALITAQTAQNFNNLIPKNLFPNEKPRRLGNRSKRWIQLRQETTTVLAIYISRTAV